MNLLLIQSIIIILYELKINLKKIIIYMYSLFIKYIYV